MLPENIKEKSSYNILIQITGSIAAFKVCTVISDLRKKGHNLRIVATNSGLRFIGAATLEGLSGQKILTDIFEEGSMMEHIHSVRWADIIVTAPASANFINKASQGITDNLALTQFLAHDFSKPYLLFPAMNQAMWNHPSTQSAFKKLKDWGIYCHESPKGTLACGETGPGRLAEPNEMIEQIEKAINGLQKKSKDQDVERTKLKLETSPASRRKILITSGGTQEKIDPVRVLTNISTGKTGAKIAEFFLKAGWEVTYVSGSQATCPGSESISNSNGQFNSFTFTDFKSIQNLVLDLISSQHFDVILHAAALSDYSINNSSDIKIDSSSESLTIELKKNPKLVNLFRNHSLNKKIQIIAFKLTAGRNPDQIQQNIQSLFNLSNCDFVVHNDLAEMIGTHYFHLYKNLTLESSNKKLKNLDLNIQKLASVEGVNSLAEKLHDLLNKKDLKNNQFKETL